MKLVLLLLMVWLLTGLNQPFFDNTKIRQISIVSLNINGISSKLESYICVSLFSMYDIVFLSELKCDYVFAVPGFKCLRSRLIPGEEKRGGVAVLIKVNLWNYVYSVSSMKDQVWFKLKCTPKIKYGCVYIAT